MTVFSGKDAIGGPGGTSVPARARRWPFVLAAGLGAVLFAGAALLWVRQGSVVFFDAITTGFGTCL